VRLQRKHRRWLKEREPPVPPRQRHHDDDLDDPEELPRDHPLVPHVLGDERQRREQEAQEVRLHERPLDLPVVDPSGSPDHDPLRGDEGAVEAEDRPGHSEFAVGFGREEEVRPEGRADIAERPDEEGEEGVDSEEGVETILGEEVVVDVEGEGAVSSPRGRLRVALGVLGVALGVLGVHHSRRWLLGRACGVIGGAAAAIRIVVRIAVRFAWVFSVGGGGTGVGEAHALLVRGDVVQVCRRGGSEGVGDVDVVGRNGEDCECFKKYVSPVSVR